MKLETLLAAMLAQRLAVEAFVASPTYQTVRRDAARDAFEAVKAHTERQHIAAAEAAVKDDLRRARTLAQRLFVDLWRAVCRYLEISRLLRIRSQIELVLDLTILRHLFIPVLAGVDPPLL